LGVVGERGCEAEASMDAEAEEEGRGAKVMPPKVLGKQIKQKA